MNFIVAFLGYLLCFAAIAAVLALFIWAFTVHVFFGVGIIAVVLAASLAADQI